MITLEVQEDDKKPHENLNQAQVGLQIVGFWDKLSSPLKAVENYHQNEEAASEALKIQAQDTMLSWEQKREQALETEEAQINTACFIPNERWKCLVGADVSAMLRFRKQTYRKLEVKALEQCQKDNFPEMAKTFIYSLFITKKQLYCSKEVAFGCEILASRRVMSISPFPSGTG